MVNDGAWTEAWPRRAPTARLVGLCASSNRVTAVAADGFVVNGMVTEAAPTTSGSGAPEPSS